MFGGFRHKRLQTVHYRPFLLEELCLTKRILALFMHKCAAE